MRRILSIGVHVPIAGLFAVLLTLSTAAAAPVTLTLPENFGDVERNVQTVKDDLSKAEFGGWDLTQSVKKKIPVVTGAPGRDGIVFEGNTVKKEVLWSGMAWRDETSGTLENGFSFPDSQSANGLSTVCNLREFGDDFPYREDPAATGEVPCKNTEACADLCGKLNYWVYPTALCPDDDGKLTVPWKGDCRAVDAGNDPDVWDAGAGDCAVTGWFYCCSEAPVSNPLQDRNRNCILCSGDGMPSKDDPTKDGNGETIEGLNQTGCRQGHTVPNGRTFVSFFRKYRVGYSRDQVTGLRGGPDRASIDEVPVECYGLYEEFDPKVTYTTAKDRRCVIDLTDAPDLFQSMRITQSITGEYGQNTPAPDPPFPRPSRDTLHNLWVTDLSDAVSFVNGKKAKEQYGDSLSLSLMPIDIADVRATVPGTAEQPEKEPIQIRATDDTVCNDRPGRRTITEWWQEQETKMHRLFTPPILRLVLPSPRSLSLDPLDPLLSPPQNEITAPPAAPHLQTIDFSLGATREDIVGEVSAYLEKSLLLHIEEEPVTVIVPLASPVELRSLAQGWKGWAERQEAGEGRTKAEAVQKKLEEYADQIDGVRAMRGELARTLGAVLRTQGEIASVLAKWLKNNADAIVAWQNSWQKIRDLLPRWHAIQSLYRTFHDRSNMPWSRSDRFTTPIYSLLDNWTPRSPGNRDLAMGIDTPPSEVLPERLPRFAVEPLADLVYDFSALQVSHGTIRLPVLRPVQIRLDMAFLAPPTFNQSMNDVSAKLEKLSQLPDLPPVPAIADRAIADLLPSDVVQENEPETVPASPLVSPTEVDALFAQMETILTGMSATYDTFWKSLTEGRDNWNCEKTGMSPCVHTEMDLRERFTRIGARPAILLKEDVLARGAPRTALPASTDLDALQPSRNLPFGNTAPLCPREDWACQVFQPRRIMQRSGWRIEGAEGDRANDALGTLRNDVRTETMPAPTFPTISKPEDLLPSFNLSIPTDITPKISTPS